MPYISLHIFTNNAKLKLCAIPFAEISIEIVFFIENSTKIWYLNTEITYILQKYFLSFAVTGKIISVRRKGNRMGQARDTDGKQVGIILCRR